MKTNLNASPSSSLSNLDSEKSSTRAYTTKHGTVAAEATPGEPDIDVAEAERIGEGFPTDAHRTLGACLRIMDALVEVRYLADSVNECADEKAWKPMVPKLLEAFRMAWDAARADVEMYNFD